MAIHTKIIDLATVGDTVAGDGVGAAEIALTEQKVVLLVDIFNIPPAMWGKSVTIRFSGLPAALDTAIATAPKVCAGGGWAFQVRIPDNASRVVSQTGEIFAVAGTHLVAWLNVPDVGSDFDVEVTVTEIDATEEA